MISASAAGDDARPVATMRAVVEPASREEDVELAADGTLTIGHARGRVALEERDRLADQQAALRAVTLDRGLRAILVSFYDADDEDPLLRHQLFVRDGRALRQLLDVRIDASSSSLRFGGDGTVRFLETAHGACARAGYPAWAVFRHRITLRRARGYLLETRRTPAVPTLPCATLAG